VQQLAAAREQGNVKVFVQEEPCEIRVLPLVIARKTLVKARILMVILRIL